MKRVLFVLIVAASLVLSACGGSSAPTTDIDVTMTDFQFSPNQFTVPAGQEISLHSDNSGAVIHNFVIMNLGQTAGPEYGPEDLPNVYWKVEIEPGGSLDTSFVAPSEAGEYEVICSTPGHLQAGMLAKMIVVENE